MTTLTSFEYTDLFDDHMASHLNKLHGGVWRAEFRNVETITATKELADSDCPIQLITASGANRTVELAPEATTNHYTYIKNAGGSNNVVVKDDSGSTTFATLAPGEYGVWISDGAAWKGLINAVDLSLYVEKSNFHIGSSAPGSPTAGMLWWDTTNLMLWVYGTFASASRWVSATLFSTGSGSSTTARAVGGIQPTVLIPGMMHVQPFDIWIDKLYCRIHVITTNNGSNYWIFQLRKVTTSTVPAEDAGTLLATINSSSISANTWADITPVSVDAILDNTGSGVEITFIDEDLQGTPGSAWFTYGYSYRLVR